MYIEREYLSHKILINLTLMEYNDENQIRDTPILTLRA